MNISLNVLDVLLFLLPGFVWFALAHENRPNIHSVLPNAGSIAILTAVPLMALVVHTIWALLFVILAHIENSGTLIFTGSFDPNIYKWIFHSKDSFAVSGGGLLYGFVMLFLISISPAICFHIKFPPPSETELSASDPRQENEDWLHFLIRKAEPEDFFLCAYVLTKIEHDKGTVGYAGIVDRIGRTSEGDISFVVIDDAKPFLLTTIGAGTKRIETTPNHSHGMSTFHREDYHSISFEVMQYPSYDGS